ncbi:MAG: hypothetical protein ABSE92_08080 [Terriglobales bacterium]|jgi:hypothetical protein
MTTSTLKATSFDSRNATFNSPPEFVLLSQLLLSPAPETEIEPENLGREVLDKMLALAQSHHVVMRALPVYAQIEQQKDRAAWAFEAMNREQARVGTAVGFLARICSVLEENQCDVTVIKSLDHWPDLGSDLDLYTNSDPHKVVDLLKTHFNAGLAPRSWGDRLANKWNFIVPGLPELVEIHVGRLGQTGEHVVFANGLSARARQLQLPAKTFRVASPEDRLMICTLQRMYRHFYARLCDIVDTLHLLENDPLGVDFEKLHHTALRAGIWEGTATFLVIVSDYVRSYRGFGIELPRWVRASAKFNANEVYFRNGFLRISIAPHSMKLYASQLASMLFHGDLASSARLTLLPCLAVAAAAGQKITGSDKGIW